MLFRALFLALLFASAAAAQERARILVIGDSVMAWNGARSIPATLAKTLGEAVRDESVSGAKFAHRFRMLVGPMDIRAQVPRLDFDWIVLIGGANDLADDCACEACEATLDALISADARLGAIPDFAEEMRLRGMRLLWAHYYRSPDIGGPFEACGDEFDDLKARIDLLSAQSQGVYTVDLARIIDASDLSLYDADRVHPSPSGSERIGAHLAEVLRSLEE
ncbi:MAG: SGNH/GDSL hydrolase family protein [Pseudomonadota bacterium]